MNTEVSVPVAGTFVTVTVTSLPSVVASQLRALKSSVAHASRIVVGLDVEWNSAYANAKPAVLQLCSGTRCLVVQLHHMPFLAPELKDFFADPAVTFVGVGIQSDAAKLRESYHLACANAVELSVLAVRKSITATTASAGRGLAQLTRDVCGVAIEKSESVARSDWTSSVLTPEQIAYAATDAYAAYLVGAKLLQSA